MIYVVQKKTSWLNQCDKCIFIDQGATFLLTVAQEQKRKEKDCSNASTVQGQIIIEK
jgi:hypothetical protein